jgi:hypothetical protein
MREMRISSLKHETELSSLEEFHCMNRTRLLSKEISFTSGRLRLTLAVSGNSKCRKHLSLGDFGGTERQFM